MIIPICQSPSPTGEMVCLLAAGHRGLHEGIRRALWDDDHPRCESKTPLGIQCQLIAGHAISHRCAGLSWPNS